MIKKYNIIYCDPPWFYNSRKAVGERRNKTKFGGGAEKHYPLMKDSDLIDMASFLESLSAENCALFMWVTMPRLDFGIELLKKWGFRYCTNAFTWIKTSKKTGRIIYGPGYYTASNTELCILGIKGKMPPFIKMYQSVFILPRGSHSVKPPHIRCAIEEIYTDAKKIELFAREKRLGWDAWGMTGLMDSPGFL